MMSIPNFITAFRIFVHWSCLYLLFIPSNLARVFAIILFIINIGLDKLDGYLARKLHQTTNFGQYFDIAVDRAIIIASFAALALLLRSVEIWPFVLMIFRDFISAAIKQVGALNGVFIKGNFFGKLKIGFELIAIIFGFLTFLIPSFLPFFTQLFRLSAIIGVISLIFYFKDNWAIMKKELKPKKS